MLNSIAYPRFLLRLTLFALVIIFNWSCMSWTQGKWNPKESQQYARLFPGDSQTVSASTINLQGLSGLAFDHETEHKLFFWTLTDRGPSQPRLNDGNQMEQVFLDPTYQPRIYQFSIDKKSGTSKIEKTIMLKDGTGTPLTGLPPCDRSQIEIKPMSALGLPLKCSSLGIDPESITRDREGNFWLGEEYRPAIMKFSPEGKLIKTYVPTKSTGDATAIAGVVNPASTIPPVHYILPASFLDRATNGGFTAIGFKDGMIYAMLQRPLPTDSQSTAKNMVPIIKIDTASDRMVGHLWYPLENPDHDLIGDLSFAANGQMLILEELRRQGIPSRARVFSISARDYLSAGDKQEPGIAPKKMLIDLQRSGFDHSKNIEGLATLPDGRIAVLNDNGFGITPNRADVILGIFLAGDRK